MAKHDNDYPLWQKVLQWIFTFGTIAAVLFILFVVASSGKHSAGLFG